MDTFYDVFLIIEIDTVHIWQTSLWIEQVTTVMDEVFFERVVHNKLFGESTQLTVQLHNFIWRHVTKDFEPEVNFFIFILRLILAWRNNELILFKLRDHLWLQLHHVFFQNWKTFVYFLNLLFTEWFTLSLRI